MQSPTSSSANGVVRRRPGRRTQLALGAVALVIGVALVLVAGTTLTGNNRDCDNMAGECIRQRQQLAIVGFVALALVTAAWCGWAAVRMLRAQIMALGPNVLGLVVSALILVFFLVVDPGSRLDDRFNGWLS